MPQLMLLLLPRLLLLLLLPLLLLFWLLLNGYLKVYDTVATSASTGKNDTGTAVVQTHTSPSCRTWACQHRGLRVAVLITGRFSGLGWLKACSGVGVCSDLGLEFRGLRA